MVYSMLYIIAQFTEVICIQILHLITVPIVINYELKRKIICMGVKEIFQILNNR